MQKNKTDSNSITAQQTELLIAILNENHSHVQALNQLLQVERDYLEQRERNKLSDIIAQKTQCLEKINATEIRLEQLLTKITRAMTDNKRQTGQVQNTGLISANTIESIIEKCPKAYRTNLKANWNQLRTAIFECQSLNAINGQIIHRSKANVETILEMMRGYSSQIDVYHADGLKERSSEQRTLAKA